MKGRDGKALYIQSSIEIKKLCRMASPCLQILTIELMKIQSDCPCLEAFARIITFMIRRSIAIETTGTEVI
jgi:hypothetical protein